MKRSLLLLILISLTGLGWWWASRDSGTPSGSQTTRINSYGECVRAGYPVQESYPTTCRVPGGKSFTNPDQKPENPPKIY